MKPQLIAIVAAVLVVGCGESQQSAPAPETKPAQPTAKAPDISIHDAAWKGNIEAVKQHLADGVDVNMKDEEGATPLHHPLHKEIAELLIAKGADVNAQLNDGITPLDFAIAGARETADLLRKHGGKTGEELKAEGN